jgi:serine protease AprX
VTPDLFAPAESVLAADAGPGSGYTTLSGTSMASPFGAGSAALVIAANPALTPDGVREILTTTAEDWGAEGPDSNYGHGRLQVLEAVEAAIRAGGGEPAPVDRPNAPHHTAAEGAGVGGVSVLVTVTDITRPIAATAIAAAEVASSQGETVDGIIHEIFLTGPRGRMLQPMPFNADRQHHVTFRPSEPGNYVVSVQSPFAFVLDVSS